MKGTNLYNKYAIRSVGIIKEKKIEKQFSLFPYYCNRTIPRIKFINVSKTLSGTSIYLEAKGIFTLLYPNYTGMDSVSPIVKGVSYKLFAYKGIGGWGVITVPELISDKFYAFCVEKEWRYFQFR